MLNEILPGEKISMEKEQEEIEVLEIKGEFTICPQCGYDGGFHSIFPDYNLSERSKWILMCPSCKAKYDIGLRYQSSRNSYQKPQSIFDLVISKTAGVVRYYLDKRPSRHRSVFSICSTTFLYFSWIIFLSNSQNASSIVRCSVSEK